MEDNDEDASPYVVERPDAVSQGWRVVGPNGLVGMFATASQAQAKADSLNEQVAEEKEDDS